MGTRENKVETYLKEEINKIGGLSRKWVSPGIDGVPDQLLIIPITAGELFRKLLTGLTDGEIMDDTLMAEIHMVEVKTTDGDISPAQVREHDRLRKKGCNVTTVFGRDDVDLFIDGLERSRND